MPLSRVHVKSNKRRSPQREQMTLHSDYKAMTERTRLIVGRKIKQSDDYFKLITILPTDAMLCRRILVKKGNLLLTSGEND